MADTKSEERAQQSGRSSAPMRAAGDHEARQTDGGCPVLCPAGALMPAEQRFTFNEEADLYDRHRLGYPPPLFDGLISLSPLAPGAPIPALPSGNPPPPPPLPPPRL